MIRKVGMYMNMYNVYELMETFEKKVSNLGVSESYRENPAYSSVLASIKSLITQMNLIKPENKTVVEENGKISFECRQGSEHYTFEISAPTPENIKCIFVQTSDPRGTDDKSVSEKRAVSIESNISKKGFITLTECVSLANDFNCKPGTYNNDSSKWEAVYEPTGVMQSRVISNYSGITHDSIEDTPAYIMLQQATAPNLEKYYDRRTIIRRESIDVARVTELDGKNNITFRGKLQLNTETGNLRELYTAGGGYPSEVVIPPMSPQLIESLIERESNEKVKEGLRNYAKGREIFSYDSKNDPDFITPNTQLSENPEGPKM